MKTAKIEIFTAWGTSETAATVSYRGKALRTFTIQDIPYQDYLSRQQVSEKIVNTAKAWAIGAGFTRSIVYTEGK